MVRLLLFCMNSNVDIQGMSELQSKLLDGGTSSKMPEWAEPIFLLKMADKKVRFHSHDTIFVKYRFHFL